MISLDKETLVRLNKKNNFIATFWLILHLAFFLSFFAISIKYLFLNDYLLFTIFYLIAGFISSFTGLCGATHEFYHNTVFENRKINKFFYRFLCTLNFINYEYNSISHKLHHKNNSYDELDSEKSIEKISYLDLILNLTINFPDLIKRSKYLILNAVGIFPNSITNNFVIGTEIEKKTTYAARTIVAYYFITISFSTFLNVTHIYLLFIITPFVMNFWVDMISRAQHYGLEKNSDNIFETTRTVYLNKILSFLNWNMNYHVEHHLYPTVPFYNLGNLNILIHKNKPEYSKERLSKFIKLLFIKNFFAVKN
jgi:fatty acid desaturase